VSRNQEISLATEDRAYHFLRKLQSGGQAHETGAGLLELEATDQSHEPAAADIDDYLFKRAEAELLRARAQLEDLKERLTPKA
jgi:hypothetical protein